MKVWALVFNESWWRSVAYAGERVPRRSVRSVVIEQAPVLVVPDRIRILHVYDHGPEAQ